jgi:hypothetical protein
MSVCGWVDENGQNMANATVTMAQKVRQAAWPLAVLYPQSLLEK